MILGDISYELERCNELLEEQNELFEAMLSAREVKTKS